MDKKPVLYILMEVKARELEGRTLLALEAASRGFQVLLGHKTDIYNGINAGYLPPGIFFDKSLTRGKEEYLKKVFDKGCHIVSQDEESGLLDFSYDRFLSVRSTSETVRMASALFCWGEHDHQSWVTSYPEARDKIFQTGSPRVDFWRSDFQKYSEQQVNLYKKKFGNFVLISSNFPGVNGFMSREELIANAIKIKSIRSPEEEKERRKWYDEDKKMFDSFVDIVDSLSHKFPELNFVVRPHPAERVSGWQVKLPDRSNVHVIFEGSISSWIRASVAVMHNGCTSGIEAYVSDKPAIAYIPFVSQRNREVPNQLSINCFTEHEVEMSLQEIMSKKQPQHHVTEQNNYLIRSRLANISNKPAVQAIIDRLEEIKVESYPIIQQGLRELKMDWAIKLRKLRIRLIHSEVKSTRKFPSLKPNEIIAIQRRLSQFIESYNNCTVKHLYGDVCTITRSL